ncbi:hypothetical protein [Nocardia brasiliensis]|uniref:hypothetical protein n=1 Tax=Nocardia brasiliensis TaxID=37326 RepID=UPI0011B2536A|nr:hypothetical protein [Nocardia brasiliensis]
MKFGISIAEVPSMIRGGGRTEADDRGHDRHEGGDDRAEEYDGGALHGCRSEAQPHDPSAHSVEPADQVDAMPAVERSCWSAGAGLDFGEVRH